MTSALSRANAEYERVTGMDSRIDDLETLVEMGTEDGGDAETMAEAERELVSLQKAVAELEVRTLLSGEYDEREAVVTIRSGAGGVDAADFAEMLMRMYLRWAERHGYPTKVMDTSYAEEAGLKSATFEVNVPYAFGNLSVEAGTHRLVRISPFDNQGRRQTSFAAVEVIPLIEQTDHIEIPENEIKVDVFRSSGPGGQSVNTTDSAVRMTHIPTGIVVSMQNEKSQIQNRAAALRVLQSRLLLQRQAEEAAERKEMAGDVKASWGDQMRSYVLQPYQMVKDLRTEFEVGNPSAVFDGDIDGFLEAGVRWRKEQQKAARADRRPARGRATPRRRRCAAYQGSLPILGCVVRAQPTCGRYAVPAPARKAHVPAHDPVRERQQGLSPVHPTGAERHHPRRRARRVRLRRRAPPGRASPRCCAWCSRRSAPPRGPSSSPARRSARCRSARCRACAARSARSSRTSACCPTRPSTRTSRSPCRSSAARATRSARSCPRPWRWSASRARRSACRTSSPVVSSSASPSPGRSSTSRRSCCATSRPATSTRPPASTSCGCSTGSTAPAPPSSWPPTTTTSSNQLRKRVVELKSGHIIRDENKGVYGSGR